MVKCPRQCIPLCRQWLSLGTIDRYNGTMRVSLFTMVVKEMITIKRYAGIMGVTENNEIHCYWVSTAIFHNDWMTMER